MPTRPKIFPIILAAGKTARLAFPKPLAPFGRKIALEIAVENCADRAFTTPVVVLGHDARKLRAAVPAGVRVVINRAWRKGQLGSLVAGLGRVPPGAPFMLCPVDHPLLTRAMLRRLAAAFHDRRAPQSIIAPRYRGRSGHPVIFSPELRRELTQAQTAKDVVYREKARIKYVRIPSSAIWREYHSPASYRRCLRQYRSRCEARRSPK